MTARKKFSAIMAGKRLVLMPGAYDALSARIIEAEGFEAIVAGGYAAVGSMLAQADMGQSNMRDYADHYGRICAAVEIPVYVDADTGFGGVNNVRQMVRAFEAAGVAGLFISDQVFPTAAATCRASRSSRSSRCSPRSKPRSTRGAIRTSSSRRAPMRPASRASRRRSRAASCSWRPAPTWRSRWASTPSPEIKRALREVGGPHMATLSQAAGPKARSLAGTGSGRRLLRDLPVGRAVCGGERGAQRAAPAQARQLARALPGASHPARRLLRSRRPEGAARARGELRQGGGGAGAEARGGMREPCLVARARYDRSPLRGALLLPWRSRSRRAQACAGFLQGQADPA